MSDPTRSVEEYLTRLAEQLDVLGPQAAAEIVAEIRGHIGEALVERDGDIDAVLAEFGSPESLATRILEERGILSGALCVAEAPTGLRLLAGLLDVAVWLFAVLAVYMVVGVGAPLFAQVTNLHALLAIGVFVAFGVVLGLSLWWWAAGRGLVRRATVGMRLLGLRRVRIGGRAITVRLADIPGASRPSRVLPALTLGFALLVVVPALFSAYWGYRENKQMEAVGVVSDVSSAASVVGELYRQVEGGASPGALSDSLFLAPGARPGVTALIDRHAKGQVDGYTVDRLELVRYIADTPGIFPSFAPKAGTVVSDIVVRAHVYEYAKNSSEGRPYVVEVRQVMTSDGGLGGLFSMGYSANGTQLVESIGPDN